MNPCQICGHHPGEHLGPLNPATNLCQIVCDHPACPWADEMRGMTRGMQLHGSDKTVRAVLQLGGEWVRWDFRRPRC